MALRGIELDIGRGQIIALLGKSGSGKTTLLNLLAGLDEATRGRVEIDGMDLKGLGDKAGQNFDATSSVLFSSSSTFFLP